MEGDCALFVALSAGVVALSVAYPNARIIRTIAVLSLIVIPVWVLWPLVLYVFNLFVNSLPRG